MSDRAKTDSKTSELIGRYILGEVSVEEAAVTLSMTSEDFRNFLDENGIDTEGPSTGEIIDDVAEILEVDEGSQATGNTEVNWSYDWGYREQIHQDTTEIISRLNVDRHQFGISKSNLQREILNLIFEAKMGDEETANAFLSNNIHRHLGRNKERATYHIFFPLNILYT